MVGIFGVDMYRFLAQPPLQSLRDSFPQRGKCLRRERVGGGQEGAFAR